MSGNTISHYRIVEKLGGSGMGTLQDKSCTAFSSRDTRRQGVAAPAKGENTSDVVLIRNFR